MEELITGSYIIEHEIKEPSKLSDFDYDPEDLGRRFISTYIHTLRFKDRITDAELVTIGFPSETCANIIVGIMGTDAMSNNHHLLSSVKGIFVNGSHKPGIMTISRIWNGDGITITILNNGETYRFDMDSKDVYKFVDLLETDQIVEMFAISSNGEW